MLSPRGAIRGGLFLCRFANRTAAATSRRHILPRPSPERRKRAAVRTQQARNWPVRANAPALRRGASRRRPRPHSSGIRFAPQTIAARCAICRTFFSRSRVARRGPIQRGSHDRLPDIARARGLACRRSMGVVHVSAEIVRFIPRSRARTERQPTDCPTIAFRTAVSDLKKELIDTAPSEYLPSDWEEK